MFCNFLLKLNIADIFLSALGPETGEQIK